MKWEYLVTFLITIINIIAMILQLKKVFDDYKKENGLEGLSFWAFNIWSFLIMISLAYMFRLRKFFFYPMYIMSFFYFVLIAFMIVYYEKSSEDKEKKSNDNIISLAVIFTAGLMLSLFLYFAKKTISNKTLTVISDIAGIGMGLCTIPYVMRVYEKGDEGISFPFLVFTLAANVAEIFSSILTRTWPTLSLMLIYLITKSIVVAKMFEYAAKPLASPEGAYEKDRETHSNKLKDMKEQLGGAGGLCAGMIILLFVARYLDKKRIKI